MKFDRTQFHWDGMYLTYGPDRKFVARFKTRFQRTKRREFMKKLIDNFTVDQYFDRLNIVCDSPYQIVGV